MRFPAALLHAACGGVALRLPAKIRPKSAQSSDRENLQGESVPEDACFCRRSQRSRLCLPGLHSVKQAGATIAPPAALEAVACLTTTQCVAVGGSREILVSSDGGAVLVSSVGLRWALPLWRRLREFHTMYSGR